MAMRINVHIEDNTTEGITTCEFLEAAGRRKGDFIVAAVTYFAKALGMQPSGSPEQIEGMILISKFANTPTGMANIFQQQLNEPVRRPANKAKRKPKPKASKPAVQKAAPQQSVQPIPAPVIPQPIVKPQPEPEVIDEKAEEEEVVLEYIHNNVDIKKLKEEIGDFKNDEELKLLLQIMTLEDGTTYYQKYLREITDMLMARSKANPVIDLSEVTDINNKKNNTVGGFTGLIDLDDLDF